MADDSVQIRRTPGNTYSIDYWDRFWFSGQSGLVLAWQRRAFCLLTLVFFASYLFSISQWFAAEGFLSTRHLGQLVQVAEVSELTRWYWSPLYWIDSSAMLTSFVGCGILLSGFAFFGVGGRLLDVTHWLVWLSVANRAWVLSGTEEIPLAIGLSSLVIAGKTPSFWSAKTSREKRVSYGLARRWLQVHAAMLAITTAIAYLTTEEPSAGVKSLACAAPALLALWFTWRSRRRELTWALCGSALLLGVATSEWLYAIGASALWLAYLPDPQHVSGKPRRLYDSK
jgi:hypothetical protein